MYFLKPGDRVIVDMGNSQFSVEVVNLLGERVNLLSGLSEDRARKAEGLLAFQDRGQIWACHQARPDALRPIHRS